MKRFRWIAALVALVLMLSWASAAQAQEESTQSTGDTITTTTTTTVPTASADEEQICTVAEGLVSHSKISLDTASAHPSASASFTVKEGCRVIVFLVSFDENGLVDSDPALESEDPSFGPGDHTLKVDLPSCADFLVIFDAFEPLKDGESPSAEELAQAQRAVAESMSEGDAAPELKEIELDEAEGRTTFCPTTTTVRATTTTAGGGQLPFTGSSSLPLLLAALVMVVGGIGAVLAARIRGRGAE